MRLKDYMPITALLPLLRLYRVAWIGGRFGGYKTSAAATLAKLCCDYGWTKRVYANVPLVFAESEAGPLSDAVLVIDEGGIFFDSPATANKLLAGLRKLNLIVLLPSVIPPSLRLQVIKIKMLYNLAWMGVPAQVWAWSVDDFAAWTLWRAEVGLHDSAAWPLDDSGISAELARSLRKLPRAKSIFEPDDDPPPAGPRGSDAAALEAAENALRASEAATRVITLVKKKK